MPGATRSHIDCGHRRLSKCTGLLLYHAEKGMAVDITKLFDRHTY